MKVWKVVNKANHVLYIAAPDEEVAIHVAQRIKHIRLAPARIEEVTNGAPYGRSIPDEIVRSDRVGPIGLVHSGIGDRGHWEFNRFYK